MSEQVSYEQARELAEQSREQDWERPSFGKELFLGNFDLSLIHPQPDEPAEMREKGDAFLERLRVFLEERVDPLQIERDAKVPDDVIQGLKDLGALGMKIPEEYGGLGLSLLYYTKAVALAGTWHSSLGALLSAHQSIGLPEPLRLFGSEEQKREWLPKLARTHISAFLLTEPDVGSDPARMSCTAVPTEDGSGYTITGTKLWATNGSIADVVVVMAMVPRSEDRKGGITAFICPCDLDGVSVTHRNEFMGVRGIENSVTRFDSVFVPKENVIGGIAMGLKIALTTLNTGRLSLPATTAAAAKYSLKISREWAAERVQWGKPIGQHDEVAQKLAFVAGTAFGIEAVVDVSCRLADDKRNDIRIEAALAKLYGSEFGWQAVDTMVQIRGGRGFETAESLKRRGEKPVPAEQLQRDMRINRIFEGSTEIMHLLIAREALDTHLGAGGKLLEPGVAAPEKAKAAAKAGKFYGSWFPKLTVGQGQRPSSYTEFGQLGRHLRFAERNSRKLARSIFYALGVHRAGLERKGALLGRFVDIGAELYAIACACVYAERLGTTEARELADLFCSQSRRRVDTLFHALWANDDDASYRTAQKVLSGRYAWLEADIADPAGDGPMIPRHEAPAVDTESVEEEAPTGAPAG
jgi:alkylation response protein AidB-like acyl-CoA dehydrogenase